MADSSLSRRSFLQVAGLAGTAAALAACAPALAPSNGPSALATGTLPPAPAGTPPSTPPPSTPSLSTAPPPSPPAQGLTLRQKIARMLVIGFRGLSVAPDAWVAEAIRDAGIAGVVLFDRDQIKGTARNVESTDQVRRLCGQLAGLAPDRDVIIAIDQEGGLVTRLSPKYGFPAVASEETIGEESEAAVRAWAEGIAGTLADAGVNLNLAPVVDLNVNPSNPAVGALDRAFSADPAIVVRDAAIDVAAHRARGVGTALKHFPGLGSATANTDFGVADVTATWTDRELDPYRELIGRDLVDLVMAAHVVNGQIDRKAPASLSRATVTDLLRGELGFDGPVITDDLQAGAITQAFGADDAVRLAIEAGCDLLLFANQQVYEPGVVGRVIDLVEGLVRDGTITEGRVDASVGRIGRVFSVGG